MICYGLIITLLRPSVNRLFESLVYIHNILLPILCIFLAEENFIFWRIGIFIKFYYQEKKSWFPTVII